MDVIVSYSEEQLNSAALWILKNNPYRGGSSLSDIVEEIHSHIYSVALKFPESSWITSGGIHVISNIESEEGIDEDSNSIFVEIYVDSSIGENIKYTTLNINIKK